MKELEELLSMVSKGKLSPSDAARLVRLNSIREVENVAKLDINRRQRTGVPEVVLAQGKSNQQLQKIARGSKDLTVFSRLSREQALFLSKRFPGKANKVAGTFVIGKARKRKGTVGIITAGTSDIPVAEEARTMAEAMGCSTLCSYDAGVAGIHRLFPALKLMLGKADSMVVIAGREGTLPAIVAGMLDIPVIGVPTSVGYGYGGGGEAALKSMLQSCAFLSVVNIDNGIGAGAFAALIAKRAGGK